MERLRPTRTEPIVNPETGGIVFVSRSYPFLHLSQILNMDYDKVLKVAGWVDSGAEDCEKWTGYQGALIREVCKAPWRWVMA